MFFRFFSFCLILTAPFFLSSNEEQDIFSSDELSFNNIEDENLIRGVKVFTTFLIFEQGLLLTDLKLIGKTTFLYMGKLYTSTSKGGIEVLGLG